MIHSVKEGEGDDGFKRNDLGGIAERAKWRNPENMCKHNLWMFPLLVEVTREKSIHNSVSNKKQSTFQT